MVAAELARWAQEEAQRRESAKKQALAYALGEGRHAGIPARERQERQPQGRWEQGVGGRKQSGRKHSDFNS